MSKTCAAWMGFLTLFLSCGSGLHEPEPGLGAVDRLLDGQVQAWNRGDLEGFMGGYWNSDELSFFSGGIVTTGWQGALDRYKRRYQEEGRSMGRLEFTDLAKRSISADCVYVTGRYNLRMEDGSTPTGIFTLILRRMSEGWKIVHDHTSSDAD